VIVGLVYTGRTLEPLDAQDAETLSNGYAVGEAVMLDVKKARNLKHHKKFMAMFGEAAEMGCTLHGNRFHNKDALRIYVEICVGWCDYYDIGPMRVPVARTINFETVDQLLFARIYNNCVLFMADELDPPVESITFEADELRAKGFSRCAISEAA
jgi:hypothetical protein